MTSAPLASRFGWLLRRRRSSEVAPAPHHFLRNKRQEWEEYRSEVTAFELRKNLPML
nr:glutamine synthetase [Streptomyces jeddahensis]